MLPDFSLIFWSAYGYDDRTVPKMTILVTKWGTAYKTQNYQIASNISQYSPVVRCFDTLNLIVMQVQNIPYSHEGAGFHHLKIENKSTTIICRWLFDGLKSNSDTPLTIRINKCDKK